MAKTNRNNKGHRRRRPKSNPHHPSRALHVYSNFVSEAGVGCYIAQRNEKSNDAAIPSSSATGGADWGMLEWEDNLNPDDFGGQEVPDVGLDPHDKTLTVCNITDKTRVAYITVYDTPLRNRAGRRLVASHTTTTNHSGTTRPCITFIVLCPPRTFAHLCSIDIPEHQSVMDVEINSDVRDWAAHPNPDDTHPLLLGFPLATACQSAVLNATTAISDGRRQNSNNETDSAPCPSVRPQHAYLCTQGEGGRLTHFFSGNLHAIDFRCPVGTPVLAVGDGVVVQVQDDSTLTGVAVSNLFTWNSILIELDVAEGESAGGRLFVEYVHIHTKSALVRLGDRVRKGQAIGSSGSVGFSPEPHLHFCAYRSQEPTAPTVRAYFESCRGDSPFLPVAGKWYNAVGEVDRPS